MVEDHSMLPEDLIGRYLKGIATPEEKSMVESWHLKDLKDSDFELSSQNIEDVHRQMRKTIIKEIASHNSKVRFTFGRIAAAITILVGLSVLYIYSQHRNVIKEQMAQIKPGTFNNDAVAGNKAILTLNNGKQIAVSSMPEGSINTGVGGNIQKLKNGTIVYSSNNLNTDFDNYNTLTVPRGGGKHEIRLSDGTLAVLDAGSSIYFPVKFPNNIRKVRITGQVYFEVVHNEKQPFFVKVDGHVIQDIGTHFNVNSFSKDVSITLLEGSIKVGNILLKTPGQQAVEDTNGNINLISHVNLTKIMAWKNDLFMFDDDATLKSVMDQIGRWYDMDVQYVGNGKYDHFGGDMPRYSKLSDILKILTFSGVRFSIDGKKIIVYQ